MNLYYFPIQTVNLVANKTTSKEKKSPAQRSGGTWPHCGQVGKREGFPGEVRPRSNMPGRGVGARWRRGQGLGQMALEDAVRPLGFILRASESHWFKQE